ncbi:hypothetical protein BU23DRAFT_662342 [Bimuria novae-zelandiae CBS 107.79]|uniref:RBR-type E3 ubiquitin transferase n=1 Tax=Bimuria novae-zelandiae CBS 107.79 TaxID=1447943 RepID=A0A6A5VUX5_9PLEO|nr:hypothetical protein BU23DRAFT_662342 [Bimuria novae-zelandiae CBS 107.79]
MSTWSTLQTVHTSTLDDEIAALTLQLEEIDLYSGASKGKYAVDHPPDLELAYWNFQVELKQYQTFLEDQKLAESIGAAVSSNGPVIAELTAQEVQSHEDHQFAIQTSNVDPEYENTPRIVTSRINNAADALGKLAREVQCIACRDSLSSGLAITIPCGDKYCPDCLKQRFVLAIKDETLMPVRCHKQPIPLPLVSRHLSAEELRAFELADLEFSTENKIYCNNRECGHFIPPGQIEPGTNKASCEHCDAVTCGTCKNRYHKDENCPDDPDLRETRELASNMGWQTCYRCGSLVILRSGCYHMTCRCHAEFCYLCGTEWKGCQCRQADYDRMLERAEEIVDRDAVVDLPIVERRRRVQQVQQQIMQNHECEHTGRFRRVEGGGRRGFRCEMCGNRHWRFILQCRHCPIQLCHECRCNRI